SACSEIRKDIGDNYADAGSAPYDSRAHREQFIQQYEQRIQEANLRLSRRFHVLVESLPCLIFHLDHEQRFRFCNTAYRDYDAMRPGIVRRFLGEEVTCELNLRRLMDRHFYCKFVPERNNVSCDWNFHHADECHQIHTSWGANQSCSQQHEVTRCRSSQ